MFGSTSRRRMLVRAAIYLSPHNAQGRSPLVELAQGPIGGRCARAYTVPVQLHCCAAQERPMLVGQTWPALPAFDPGCVNTLKGVHGGESCSTGAAVAVLSCNRSRRHCCCASKRPCARRAVFSRARWSKWPLRAARPCPLGRHAALQHFVKSWG